MINNLVKFSKSSRSKSKKLVSDIQEYKRDRKEARRMKQANKYYSIDECLN